LDNPAGKSIPTSTERLNLRSGIAEIPLSGVKTGLDMECTGFRHEALIYRDSDEYLAATLSFLREGLSAGEPALVAVSRANAGLLEGELRDGEAVRFADIESLGRNPARIIPFWRDFLDKHRGVPVRGIDESLWPGRGVAGSEECERHESLLNLAFASAPGWSLLCPYDATDLDDEVLERVSRSHHVVSREGVMEASFNREAHVDCFAGELRGRPPGTAGFEFERADLAEVRRRVEESAQAVGIEPLDVAAVVVAASELAANSVAHGGGRGTLRIWTEPKKLLIEVQDGGRIEEPLVGRVRPLTTQQGGRGLWMANQLCDLVQIRSGEDGTTVRLRASRP
jgi:anti-sigma regulatory factor (Ser/Thr protein kinase)